MPQPFPSSPVSRLRVCHAWVLAGLRAVVGVLLLALLLWVGAAVMLRYGFGVGVVGADEWAVWLHLALIALGAPLALAGSLSMRLDVLRQALPRWGRWGCDVLADALTLISAWALALGAWQLVQTLGGLSPALGLPEWWRIALFVPGGALLVLQVLWQRWDAQGDPNVGQHADQSAEQSADQSADQNTDPNTSQKADQSAEQHADQIAHVQPRVRLARVAGLLLSCALAAVAAWWAPVAAEMAAAGTAVWLPAWPPSAGAALVVALGIAVAAPLPHVFLAAAWLAMPLAAAQGITLGAAALANAAFHGMSPFLLLAIPFFLLAGAWLTASGMAARLVRLAAALVGHWRDGLAQTTLLTSVFFSGASGSSVANAAFGAATFQRELVQRGYAPERAGAIIAAASVLDNLIPPSIALLILASVTQLPVGRLFVGGAVAGLVMAACLAVAFHLTARRDMGVGTRINANVQPKASPAERRAAALGALPALGLALIVLLGIRLGIVTTTEAAVLAALYTLGLNLWQRTAPAALWKALQRSAGEAAAIALLIGSAAPLAFLLAVDGIPAALASAVMAWAEGAANWLGSEAAAVLLLSCLLLLAVGLVLDIGAAIVLLGPLLLPLAVQVGLDPVTFGVIVVVALMIGGLTPPVGLLVFVVSGVAAIPARKLFAAGLPYLAALVCALALLCVGLLVGG